MKKKTSLLVLIVLLVSSQIQAQSISQLSGKELNTITTAVPFLQIAPDSRGGAMGDVGCATSADINSQAYNPAKYVFNKNTSVSASPTALGCAIWYRTLTCSISAPTGV